MWLEFPNDVSCLEIDDQWMVGDALLVKPVVKEGQTSVDVYFPTADTKWFDVRSGLEMIFPFQKVGHAGVVQSINAPINYIPVFQRGGTIVPRKMRLRRSGK